MKNPIVNYYIDKLIKENFKISKITEKSNGSIMIRAHNLKDRVRMSLYFRPKIQKGAIKN